MESKTITLSGDVKFTLSGDKQYIVRATLRDIFEYVGDVKIENETLDNLIKLKPKILFDEFHTDNVEHKIYDDHIIISIEIRYFEIKLTAKLDKLTEGENEKINILLDKIRILEKKIEELCTTVKCEAWSHPDLHILHKYAYETDGQYKTHCDSKHNTTVLETFNQFYGDGRNTKIFIQLVLDYKVNVEHLLITDASMCTSNSNVIVTWIVYRKTTGEKYCTKLLDGDFTPNQSGFQCKMTYRQISCIANNHYGPLYITIQKS